MLTRQELYQLYDQGPRAVINLIEDLYAHIASNEPPIVRTQRLTIEAQYQEILKLQARLKKVELQLGRQRCRNYELQQRLQELESQTAKATPSTESSVHRPPSADPPWHKRRKSLRRPSGRLPGGQPGHRGSTRQPEAVPDQIITHAPETCRRCGAALSDGYPAGEERRQVVDLPAVKPQITEHRRLARRCTECGEVTRGEFPSGLRGRVQYGRGVRAAAIYLTQYQLLPYRRAAEVLAALFGCPLSPGTLRQMVSECAERLVRSEARIKEGVRRSAVVHADETGLRVEGKCQYVHVASTEQLTHYAVDERRGKAAMDAIGILPQFGGTCVHDGWFAYAYYHGCRHSLCGVHLLRELLYIEETHPHQRGVWAGKMAKLLLEIKRAVDTEKEQGRAALDGEQLGDFERRYDRLVRRGLDLNPPRQQKVRAGPAGNGQAKAGRQAQTLARNLVARLERNKPEVLRFMRDFAVPFDNNLAERDIRMVKLQQKIGGSFRAQEGAREFCRIRSYISSVRKQGKGVLPALERVFSGLPLL